jgi:hypothetical protein
MAAPDHETCPIRVRLLRLRDRVALSRVELASHPEIPRARLLSELDSLLVAGLVHEAGSAPVAWWASLHIGRAHAG